MGRGDVAYAGAVRDLALFSLLFGTGWRILSALVDGIFFGLTLMADVARHPGVVACAASGRGQGLAQPLAPYDPQPRVGAAIPDEQHDYAGNALCPSLPRGSGRSDSRCPAPTRDERPSGVGASAPAGRRSPPRPASLASASRNRCSRFASGTASHTVEPGKRLSVDDSVQWVGETVLVMREMLPAGRSTNHEKPRHPSEPGRGGDPRNAGAPQQARISPAKREDARRLAPCGERRTRHTTCDSDARHHTGQGGVRGS